jgi:RecB family exonuclease
MISENGESSVYRPDRILKNAEGYIIVDFKTGEESEKNDRQIAHYKNILEKLGKRF